LFYDYAINDKTRMEKMPSMPMLFPYEPTEFWQQLRQVVQEELTRSSPVGAAPATDEVLLSRKEVARRLSISLVTLNDWVKRGLPSHKLRGKVYFIDSEIMGYIKERHLSRPRFPPRL
jgi:hypothetical protein